MKKTLTKTILLIIAMLFILGMFAIAEALSNLVTMDMIMTVVYISLGYSFIYIFKN